MTPKPPLRAISYLAPIVEPLYEALGQVLARRLGRRLVFSAAESYESLVEDADDVAFVCSVPYVLLQAIGPPCMVPVAAPVLTGARYAGRPIYFSDVIVSTASPFQCFADLRGSTLAYNEAFSQSGFVTVCAHLEHLGESNRFFGELYPAGFHQQAVRLVADGQVAAAAIDSQVLSIQLRDDPELGLRIRIIATLGPSAIQPVVASTQRLSSEERQIIRSALLEAHCDQAVRPYLAAALVQRFVAVDDRDYAEIRSGIERAERAGLLPAGWRHSWPQQPVVKS